MSREIVDREHVGRLMHESWCRTKRAQDFHGPNESCTHADNDEACSETYGGGSELDWFRCDRYHADLIPWDDLPKKQKDINRHAFDDVLPYFERLLAAERERFVFERVPTIEDAIKEISKTLRPFDTNIEVQTPYLRARLKQLIGSAVKAEREKVREMCCAAFCSYCREDNKNLFTGVDGFLMHRITYEGTDVSDVCAAAPIRQLDLTKRED